MDASCPRRQDFECFNIKGKQNIVVEEEETKAEVDLDPRTEFEEGRPTFDEPMTSIQIGRQPNQWTRVGRIMIRLLKNEIEHVIIANVNLFAWSPTGMLGIDPDFMCHKLAILPQAKPIVQRKRKLRK